MNATDHPDDGDRLDETDRDSQINEFLEKLGMAGQRPDQTPYMPKELWSEIKPGLWVGGTGSSDEIFSRRPIDAEPEITKKQFDTVITMYAWARPVDWFVKEIRFGIYDADMSDFEVRALQDLVKIAHSDWREGQKVLVRCQAGINRSSLVAALVLIRDGMKAEEAIALLREKRAGGVLRNSYFEEWLLAIDPKDWRH